MLHTPSPLNTIKTSQLTNYVITIVTFSATATIVACMLSVPSPLWSQETRPKSHQRQTAKDSQILQNENLVAWCIVPFDAAKRGPAERAEMVVDLGLQRVAYDWRDVHVPSFEQEIIEYKKRDIEFFAFWSWHPSISPLVKKHAIHPQFWLMLPNSDGGTQAERVQKAVEQILPRVKQAAELKCKVGIYNHGGWAGEPANMVAVCKSLKEMGYQNVGVVYNFHHGHNHIRDFAAHLKLMKPHLLCLNLNGMNNNAEPKILPIGQGQHDAAMIRTVLDSGYDGPIGILDHRPDLDSAKSLKLNLNGLKEIRESL